MIIEIAHAVLREKSLWNALINRHYPPVGAFMHTWEWGVFQEALGRNVQRYFLKHGGEHIGAFMLVRHAMPFGFSYGYMPRGPVIAPDFATGDILPDVLRSIAQWAREHLSDLVFVRMEPPVPALAKATGTEGFKVPPYYIQPRFNLVIPLDVSEEKIAASFHASTRSNIRRAKNRGVTVLFKDCIQEAELDEFFAMVRDTIRRNGGANAYPDSSYFKSFFQSVRMVGKKHDPKKLSVGMFSGYQNGAPAATHFVVFFGDTATYLYGASYTDKLSSKVSTYLHWTAMREAKARGLKYYDLGGIDDARWPTLTNFKRQFRGQEFRYVGNLDVPIRPLLYWSYNLLRSFKHA